MGRAARVPALTFKRFRQRRATPSGTPSLRAWSHRRLPDRRLERAERLVTARRGQRPWGTDGGHCPVVQGGLPSSYTYISAETYDP